MEASGNLGGIDDSSYYDADADGVLAKLANEDPWAAIEEINRRVVELDRAASVRPPTWEEMERGKRQLIGTFGTFETAEGVFSGRIVDVEVIGQSTFIELLVVAGDPLNGTLETIVCEIGNLFTFERYQN